jgi:uroporphyrinogen decarboxylase
MNSRQRVLTALSHAEPDQVPVDLGGTENSTIARIAYLNLRDYLGLPVEAKPYVINRMMDAVFPQEDLLRRFGVDFRPVRPSPAWQPEQPELPDDSFYDELSIRWKKAAYYYDMVEHPLRHCSLEEITRFRYPDPYAPGRVAGLREQAKKLVEETEFAIVLADIVWGPFELGCALRGYEQFCMDLLQDVRLAETLLDKNLELALGFWDAYLSEVGEYIQIVGLGDDLAMQTGPIISPNTYRKLIKPLHKQLIDLIHTKTRAKIFMHCCGSVYDLLPDLIETGVEILNPVQVSAAKMDLRRLKHDFGDQLTFWGGGVDTQQVLPYASLPEIREHVRRAFDILAPGGGFVFAPVHNLQADITPERIQAVYETALECRKYH